MSPIDSSTCAVCQVPAKLSCSACKSIKYCGAEHQRQHWKKHKTDCRPFRVANDEQLGRFLLSTRNITAGNVIFTELPLVVGPKWYLTERDEQVLVMPCVGCFIPCRIGANQCLRCHWPACSPNCAGLENTNLHGMECIILSLGPGPTGTDPHSLLDYYRSDALVVLKCLLLQRSSPKKWTELMDMQSHEKEREGSELHNDAEKRIVSYLQRNFLNRLKSVEHKSKEKFLKEYEPSTLHRICGIIETNYMCINLPNGLELSGVFYNACMMEHSCQPNCYFQFDHRNGFKISVIAGREIQKGEHLIIMYSNMLWGTQMRNEHLAITKHFQCKCKRCTDPTEFGTNFSALLCVGDVDIEHCGGVQLPKDPLNPKSDWCCNVCPMIISGEEVRYLLTQITNEVEDLLARKPTIKQLETLQDKLSKFLHPNHYHMFSLKHSLIQLYGTESGYTMDKLNNSTLDKKLQICEELYSTCEKLDPSTIRLSIYVGIILYEMHTILTERGKRLVAKKDKTQADVNAAICDFQLSRDHLLKAAKVLEKELDNIAGNKLSDAILKALNNMELLITKSSAV
ncbi:SET domain-containing protein SmydA-8-like [Teleopsis dalmanni]|uniref:SET domain-containing protein SmydA-8-like n=1 Tax=Teleopsis dalmanni TaxID=139649 RepID=UPI0018CE07F7|nr:SET domain-containing protein SmydA-8-like [Teleopsis dalmanni]